MKKFAAVILGTVLLTSSFTYGAYASNRNVKVNVDNKEISFTEASPYIDSNGRVLVPLRFVSESIGAQVEWDSVKKEAVIIKDGKEIKVGDEAVISSGRTMVPVRFVSEALGAKVAWDKVTYTVVITTDGSEPVVSVEPPKPQAGMTAAGIPVEEYNKFHPELKKVHDSRFFATSAHGDDLTQPESVLNPKGLMSERQALTIIAQLTDPNGKSIQDWIKLYNDPKWGNVATKEDVEEVIVGRVRIYTELNNFGNALNYDGYMKMATSNNLLIDNKTSLMLELKDGKYRLNIQAIQFDPFNKEAGRQFLVDQINGRGVYSKTMPEPRNPEWFPFPSYWN